MDTPSLKEVMKSEKHEEYVEYFVFPPSKEDPEGQLFRFNAACQSIVGDYIWHNDPFALRLTSVPLSHFDEDDDDDTEMTKTNETDNTRAATKPDSNATLYFHGITRFGDNLEDEWFVVHILKELSKQFPGVVVRVIDNDGEFLLIEAADYLPNWAESDASCRQRVYLSEGTVHLIPKDLGKLDSTLSEITGTPTVCQAVDIIRSHSNGTIASENIQKAIDTRIGNYPAKMEENFHHVNIMLPPLLAAILKEKPNFISSGALAFYNRDPISLKATRLMKSFKPGDCLVKTRVRLTKCLYAMLTKQDFRPDARSGWTIPRPTSVDFKAHTLGAKLTTGFEILLSRGGSASATNGTEFNDSDPSWVRYEETLKKTGYFRGYLEGSKPYQDLLNGAKDFFKINLSKSVEEPNSSSEGAIVQQIQTLVHTTKVDVTKLKEESQTLPEDDDDSWLDIKPEDLESLLEAKFQSGGLNPDDIPSKLKEFMKQISDFSGVESGPPGTHQSGSPNSSTGSPRGNGVGGESQDDFGEPFDFKADEFVSALDKLLHDLGGPDKDWEASDDSYGSEEDDFDVNLEDIKKMSKESKEFFGIMNQMDNELASTQVGKTFKPSSSSGQGTGSSSSTTAASCKPSSSKSSKSKVSTANVDELDEFDEDEGLTPVNIDMNALANILESFQSQDGPSGPSANLLRSVGFDMSRIKKN